MTNDPELTDIEMTELCAEAMGLSIIEWDEKSFFIEDSGQMYNPLVDNAQAMDLIQTFWLEVVPRNDNWWVVSWISKDRKPDLHEVDMSLNRAIVACVAKMQLECTAPETVALGKELT